MRARPTKTFGMRTPTDLYRKLLFDIERLNKSGSSVDKKYAAFDCAVDAWHLVDWVGHAVADEHYERLWGKARGKKHKEGDPTFLSVNQSRLPALPFCHQIANSVKHVIITWGKDRDDISTGSSVKFSPPFLADKPDTWAATEVSAFVYIKVGDEKYPVFDLFDDMANQWREFLIEEGLFEPEPPEPPEPDL